MDPKGRSLEVLFAYALRCCRMADRESRPRGVAWSEVEPLFDREVARCKGTNYEFSTLAGAYLGFLDYMSPRWVEKNLDRIFAGEDQAAFVGAVGGLAYARPSGRVYGLLRESGVIDAALAAELRGRDVREKLIERILVAFMRGEESIESPRMRFSFRRGNVGDLKAAATFLWMIRDEQLTAVQRRRVVEYWKACSDWATAQRREAEDLFESLGHLAWALENVEGENLELLLAVVPHMLRRHNIYELLKELRRLVVVSAGGVGRVLRLIVDTRSPVYDYEDRLKSLIVELAEAGERETAMHCANGLIALPGMREVYGQLFKSS